MAFGALNTKKDLTWDVLNAKIFGIDEQCNLKFESVDRNCKIFIVFYSLFSLLSHSSLLVRKMISSFLILSQPLLFSSLTLATSPLFLSTSTSQRFTCATDLSLTVVLLLLLLLWFDGWVPQWEGLDGDGWVRMIDDSVGVDSDGDGWVWMGRLMVGGLGCGWVS